jgi:hypothetical protein
VTLRCDVCGVRAQSVRIWQEVWREGQSPSGA